MNWKVLKTEKDYNHATQRVMEIFNAKPNTPEDDELALLILLVSDYDNKHYKLPEINVLEIIKEKMSEQGLKNKDLEPIIGSKGHVSSILSGRRELTLKMAKQLKDFFPPTSRNIFKCSLLKGYLMFKVAKCNPKKKWYTIFTLCLCPKPQKYFLKNKCN